VRPCHGADGIVEGSGGFMVVKIRFGQGQMVKRRKGKNSRIATFSASLLTLASISCASLGMWRVATDLNWAGDFVFQEGFLSHWQVWIGVATGVQYAAWRLTRYAESSAIALAGISPVEESATVTVANVIASV
jgi:hypothetical protein